MELKPGGTGRLDRSALSSNALLSAEQLGATGLQLDVAEQAEEGLRLRELWRKVWRRKWLVLLITTLVTSLVALHVSRIKSLYQATTTIELGKEDPLMVRSGELIIQSEYSELYTGMFLLRSRPLLEDVILKYGLDRNPRFLEINSRGILWPGFQSKPSSGQDAADHAKSVEMQDREAAESGPSLSAARSQAESDRLSPYVAVLKENLSVEQLLGSRLLSMTFSHTDPVLAAKIVNGLAQQFIERSFERKTEKYSNTAKWLNRSTHELEAQMQRAEQALADYSRTHNIFSTEGKENLTGTKLAHLHDQVMRAETDRLLKQSLYEEVRKGHVAQLPEAFSDARAASLRQKLSDLMIAAAQLSVKYGPDNPKVREAQQEIEAIRRELEGSSSTLEEKLSADYERAARDERSLKSALDQAKAEAVQQNQTAIQFNILRQNVETSKSLYTDFLQRTSQAKVQMAEQYRTVSVAEPAETPTTPVGPLRFRAIVLAFVLSFAGGIGIAFLLDHLDNTIRNSEDVNRFVGLPMLGVIPMIHQHRRFRRRRSEDGFSRGEEKRPFVDPESLRAEGTVALPPLAQVESSPAVTEAYRMLRTAVLLSTVEHAPKTILVTSSQAGDGKTTTAVNTGLSLAQLGGSVILVDADLRRPQIHKLFFDANQPCGLSTFLAGLAELDDVIQASPVPNLSLLSSGMLPPNSAELVSSEKMSALLDQLAERFDHIIIDSPPVSDVTDPVILSRLVDGVILVVQSGKSERDVVRHARQELHRVGAKMMGVVLNKVNLRRDGYNYYYRYGNGPYRNGKSEGNYPL
jgi:succinoglycan biosynthesis transport protein ExoP